MGKDKLVKLNSENPVDELLGLVESELKDATVKEYQRKFKGLVQQLRSAKKVVANYQREIDLLKMEMRQEMSDGGI